MALGSRIPTEPDEKLRIARQRRHYFDLRKSGHDHETASSMANESYGTVREDDLRDLQAKADARAAQARLDGGGRPAAVVAEPAGGPGRAASPAQSPGGAPDDRSSVVIPDDWRDLVWPDLRALGASLSDDPVVSRHQAEAAIEAELERRERAA